MPDPQRVNVYTIPSHRSFADALAASAKARTAFTSADVERRATIFLQRSVAHGVSRVRTHTDVDPVVALKSMEGGKARDGRKDRCRCDRVLDLA